MIKNFETFINESELNEEYSEELSISDLMNTKTYKKIIKPLGGEILWDNAHQAKWIDGGMLHLQFETHNILPSEPRYSKIKKEFPEFDFKNEQNKIYKFAIDTERNIIYQNRIPLMNGNLSDGRLVDLSKGKRPYVKIDNMFLLEKCIYVIAEGMKDIIDEKYWELYKNKTNPQKTTNRTL